MAACYVNEEEVWKCAKHPSKRHRQGVCPTCLRERLSSLCPNCAALRPCACLTTTSSSFSGSVGRVSSLIESEPAFRRSRSVAMPFVGSKEEEEEVKKSRSGRKTKGPSSSSWWWWLRGSGEAKTRDEEEERRMMMRKSRSVSVAVTTSDYNNNNNNKTKGAKWYFPSPIKAFRQTKVVVHQHSPMYRG